MADAAGYRLQQGNAALSYQEMKAALGEPKSVVPADRELALSASAWWLRSSSAPATTGRRRRCARSPASRAGAWRRGARRPTFTEFDGYVPEAGPVLDPCAPGNVYSVTELEKAAECPFRFFLKRGLGIRPVDERERDRDVWLDPLTRGSELHDLYAALLRTVPRREAPADAEGCRLAAEVRAGAADGAQRGDAGGDAGDPRARVEGLPGRRRAVPRGRGRRRGHHAVGFEVSFGRPLEDDEEPLARAEPVEIDLGGGLTFRIAGRIDRIDQVGPATFEVLDYKTGGFWRDNWKGAFNGGRVCSTRCTGWPRSSC